MVTADSTVQWNLSFSDATGLASGYGCTVSGGLLSCSGDQTALVVNPMINITKNTNNVTLEMLLRVTNRGGGYVGHWKSDNDTSYGSDGKQLFIRNDGTNTEITHDDVAPSPVNIFSDSNYHLLRIVYLTDTTWDVYVDGSFTANIPGRAATVNMSYWLFRGAPPSAFDVDWIAHYNSTTTEVNISDPTPPSITDYNLTNGDGCESWNTDKNTACNSSFAAPTVSFNTNENAWCAIAASTLGALDKNYTDMGNSRNCTGAASGEGGINHLCTVTLQDEIVYQYTFIYISCKDNKNNQNRTSTSGPLNISVTLEANARDNIEQGIRNALLSGYTIYTEQRIYARNSANTQSTGVFDKVVKKLSKIWAFNRIGISESHANMFNITPVFYTLEFTNKTSEYIINHTERMINTTK